MTEREIAMRAVATGCDDRMAEAAALRSLAGVYLLASRNHRAAGGCRQLIALRIEELAHGLQADADELEVYQVQEEDRHA